MPELPEVETVRRGLEPVLTGAVMGLLRPRPADGSAEHPVEALVESTVAIVTEPLPTQDEPTRVRVRGDRENR